MNYFVHAQILRLGGVQTETNKKSRVKNKMLNRELYIDLIAKYFFTPLLSPYLP